MQPYYEVVMRWTGGRDLDLKYRTSAHGSDIGYDENGAGNGVHSGDVGRACGGSEAEERITWVTPGTRDDVVILGTQAPGTDVECAVSVVVGLYVYGELQGSEFKLDTQGDQMFSFNVEPPQDW